MKKLFMLACFAMLATVASAQITWNAKLGGGFASMAASDSEDDTKLHFVGKVGVGIEYPLTENWSLMPSLEFAMKGWKLENTSVDYESTVNLYYLQIPIVAAYRLNLNDDWNLTLKAGPYLGYGLFGNYEAHEGSYSWDGSDVFSDDDGAKRFDAGLDVGIDFEHHRYVFGLEFERGLVSLTGSSDYKLYNQAFYVTVGYKF